MPGILPGPNTVLILVDLQNWIVGMQWAPIAGGEVVEACVRLRESFAAAEAPVVLVRYLRADGGAAAEPNQLVPELAPQPGEYLVTKNGLDAFEGTDLAEHLRGLGTTRLVIGGLSTAHGVAATATAAMALGYEVVVVADATASVTTVEHTAALDELARSGVRVHAVEDAATR
jgi:nicotinamidase-related amidase